MDRFTVCRLSHSATATFVERISRSILEPVTGIEPAYSSLQVRPSNPTRGTPAKVWSRPPVSNRPPHRYQRCALPDELERPVSTQEQILPPLRVILTHRTHLIPSRK